jgi:hypothetical protein
MVAFKAFVIFGNTFMCIRVKLDGRSMKSKVMAIGAAAYEKKCHADHK